MNSTEAQKGFLTFIATLTIAVGIFFATYLGVTSLNSKANNSATLGVNTESSKKEEAKKNVFANLATTTSEDISTDKQMAMLEEERTADVLGTSKAINSKPAVLAGADTNQSTQGATPTTGFSQMIYIVALGASTVLVGIYFGIAKARVMAIKKFEENTFREF